MIFESEDPDPAPSGRRKFATQLINFELVERVRAIYKTSRNVIDEGDMAKLDKVKPRVVDMTEDAENLAVDYEKFIHNKRKSIRKKGSLDNVYNRAAQFAEQIALIIAVGKNQSDSVIESDDMHYGINLINYLTDRMHFIAMHHISNNEFETVVKKIINMIREYGKRGMTRSQFTKKTQYLSRHVREDILESLATSGQIKIAVTETGGQIIYPIREKGAVL